MTIRILTGSEITPEIFNQMYSLEISSWPPGDPAYIPEKYLHNLFADKWEGVFVRWDQRNNTLAGHMYSIITTSQNLDEYIRTGDFTVLKNTGFTKGNNIMYIYTAILKEEYRGSGCMKKLGIAFCQWLDQQEHLGHLVEKAYAEAVSTDGARVCTDGFMMTPMNDVDDRGIGHYVSEDGLKTYRQKMKKYC